MARRSDHSREELAALVIGAARDIMASEGRAALSMRGIAARIGYAPGSIYNAVGELEAVLLRVNAGTMDALAARLEAAAAGPHPALAKALALADAYLAFVAEHRLLWSALVEQQATGRDVAPPWYEASRARLIALVTEALAPLFLDPAARQRAVVTLWAALQGLASMAASNQLHVAGAQHDPRALARSLVARYLTGEEPG